MFKKFAMTAALATVLFTGNALANPYNVEVCEARQNLALHIMGARQSDIPEDDVANAADSVLGRRLTSEAYQFPIERTKQEKVQSLVNFSINEYNRCMSEKSI